MISPISVARTDRRVFAAPSLTQTGRSIRARSRRSSTTTRIAAYVLYSGAHPAGFAFVSHLTSRARLMSEFFVVRGLRGHGIARAAVDELFALYPGEWEIPFQERNIAAARFWRRVARDVAGENVREELRPVPGKPEVPHDVWLMLNVGQ